MNVLLIVIMTSTNGVMNTHWSGKGILASDMIPRNNSNIEMNVRLSLPVMLVVIADTICHMTPDSLYSAIVSYL